MGCVEGEVKDGQASTSKIGAIVVLSFLVGKQLSMDDVPDQVGCCAFISAVGL